MKGQRRAKSTAGVALVFLLLTAACALPSRAPSEPQPRIAAPLDGSTVLLGDTVTIRAIADDPQGIAWVQLWVDGRPAGNVVTPEAPVTLFTADLLWTADEGGERQLQVVAQNNLGRRSESDPITLYVSADMALRATVVAASLATATPNPFAVTTPLPSAPYTPPPPFTPTPGPCYDGAAYVADVTLPDGSRVEPGAAFDKTWRLRNTGTCTWDTRYQFVFVGGSQLAGPSPVSLSATVPPGGTVDVTVPMIAPDAPGTYRSQWQMRNPDGRNFGSVVFALIQVHPGPEDLPVITRFQVIPEVISQGQSAVISWEYVNGTFAVLYPEGRTVGPAGSLPVSPQATTSYRLVVSNQNGSVDRTITLVVQPPPSPPPPPASPANLTVTAVRADGFDFTWTDTSPDEQGFRLYNADTREPLTTFGPNVTSGSVGGLTCQTSYRFYLVAFNAGGESWPSNTVQATTGACEE